MSVWCVRVITEQKSGAFDELDNNVARGRQGRDRGREGRG